MKLIKNPGSTLSSETKASSNNSNDYSNIDNVKKVFELNKIIDENNNVNKSIFDLTPSSYDAMRNASKTAESQVSGIPSYQDMISNGFKWSSQQ